MPTLYLPLILLSAVVGMGVAFFAWLHRDQPGARPLTVFVVAASFWAVAEGLGLATGGLGSLRFWNRVGLTLSTVVPVAWLVTALEFTGHGRWLTRRRLAALLVEPAAFTFLVWTNGTSGLHELMWTAGGRGFVGDYSTFVMEFGLGFWAHQVYSYVLVTAGGFLLLRMILRSRDLYRTQSTALLGAMALPMIGNALYVFRAVPAGLDPTGIGWVLAGVLLTVAALRTHLLALSPATRDLGREEMLTELDDPVYILDDGGRLLDANPAAAALVDADAGSVVGDHLADVLPALATAIEGGEHSTDLQLERGGQVRYFDVRISELYRSGGAISGRLVSLRDVTDRRQREQRLDVLNRLLRHNLRNELNVVQGNAELLQDAVEDGSGTDRIDRIVDTVDTVIERANKVQPSRGPSRTSRSARSI
ncbi:histidine kinase N-terminal 7TM domain-containing protein [Halobacteriales archaeon Cl-PHB]